jgi:hypothetical protein
VKEDVNPMNSLAVLHRVGPEYAKAKAERVYIEESLRTVKALEAAKSPASSVAQREMDAYASEAYRVALEGLRAAIEQEESKRWLLIAAQTACEVYRTMEASNRNMDRAAR